MCTKTTALNNAPSMLEACRIELEKCGFNTQAAELRGIEIFTKSDAQQALGFLRVLSRSITGSARYACNDAISLLSRV